MKRTGIRRMCLLAGAMVMSTVASAFFYDATVTIDKALNSPTLTVRYNGAVVALVELRVNGVSVGTRTITSGKDSGETNFTLDLSSLKGGDNDVEVRLFDKTGKLVGSEKSSVTAEDGSAGPVFLSSPKIGATVQGPVDIKVGFGRSMRNVYVSFFVDDQFKSMVNIPPYDYLWDTARESNGWHEVEAWVVDDTSTTFKTRSVKVYVNNPSGNTARQNQPQNGGGTPVSPAITTPKTGTSAKTHTGGGTRTKTADLEPISNGIHPGRATGSPAHMKPGRGVNSLSATGPRTTKSEPATSGLTSENPVRVALGPSVGSKNTHIPGAVAAGQKQLTPTGTRTAATVPANKLNAAARMIQIDYGRRLPDMPAYAIVLDSKYVDFDVSPSVRHGVPLTPFRHLLEHAGGVVNWDNAAKIVDANAEGKSIWIKIGDRYAKVNRIPVELELSPFIEKGRTIVPLSFIKSTLDVDIQYDPTTGHVLITSKKK